MLKATEVKQQGGNVELNRDCYDLRVLEPKFEVSKAKGNPMIVLNCEILGKGGQTSVPDVHGEVREIAGMKVRYNFVLTPDAAHLAFEMYKKLGKPVDDIDEHNPDIEWLKGVTFTAILSAEQRFAMQSDGKTPITDAEGQRIPSGFAVVNAPWDILGLCKFTYGPAKPY